MFLQKMPFNLIRGLRQPCFQVSKFLFVSLVQLGLKFGCLFRHLLLLLLVALARRLLQGLNFSLDNKQIWVSVSVLGAFSLRLLRKDSNLNFEWKVENALLKHCGINFN